jgi:hypothetical protein
VFDRDPEAARRLLAVGEKRADVSLPAADLAAAAAFVNVLMSHDEVVTRR